MCSGAIKTLLDFQETPEMEKAINDYISFVIHMQRWRQSAEVEKAVLFLASSDASYMTGSEITIDGGLGEI